MGWLAPVENGLRDVRSEVAEADEPREVGWTDTFLLGQCGERRPAAARECGVEAGASGSARRLLDDHDVNRSYRDVRVQPLHSRPIYPENPPSA